MREKFFKNEITEKIPRNSMTSERWVTLISVVYLGHGRHGTCHGDTLTGGAKTAWQI